jgi:hypothetical protein
MPSREYLKGMRASAFRFDIRPPYQILSALLQ